eukprot:jgi/Mesvir1/12052/Mv00338-RA.1
MNPRPTNAGAEAMAMVESLHVACSQLANRLRDARTSLRRVCREHGEFEQRLSDVDNESPVRAIHDACLGPVTEDGGRVLLFHITWDSGEQELVEVTTLNTGCDDAVKAMAATFSSTRNLPAGGHVPVTREEMLELWSMHLRLHGVMEAVFPPPIIGHGTMQGMLFNPSTPWISMQCLLAGWTRYLPGDISG